MPVTAKLSREFYERLGDAVANELVNWLNTVDAENRAELTRLSETTFARFDAKLEQRVAELGASLRTEFRTGLADLRSGLLTWIVGLWITTMLGLAGLFVAVRLP